MPTLIQIQLVILTSDQFKVYSFITLASRAQSGRFGRPNRRIQRDMEKTSEEQMFWHVTVFYGLLI